MELHHDKHHQAYVTGANTALEQLAEARETGDLANVNKLEKNLAFNLGGHVNHSSSGPTSRPTAATSRPASSQSAIDDHFGSFDKFRRTSPPPPLGVQGSGWAVLAGTRSART